MNVKLTPLYIGTAFVIIMILVSSMFTIGTWLGWWGVVEVYDIIWTFIVNWVIVITFAILGGILFGMFVGFRLLSSQGFTPFEKEMLMMFAKLEDIHTRVVNIEQRIEAMDQSHSPATPGTTSEGSQKESQKEPQ